MDNSNRAAILDCALTCFGVPVFPIERKNEIDPDEVYDSPFCILFFVDGRTGKRLSNDPFFEGDAEFFGINRLR